MIKFHRFETMILRITFRFLLCAYISSMHADGENSVELWQQAMTARTEGDIPRYLRQGREALESDIKAMNAGEMGFAVIAPRLVAFLSPSEQPTILGESGGQALRVRGAVLNKLAQAKAPVDKLSKSDFSALRRSLTNAVLAWFSVVTSTADSAALSKADAEIKAAASALQEIPVSERPAREEWDFGNATPLDRYKSPVYRAAVARLRAAKTSRHYAESLQQDAVQTLPGLTEACGGLLGKLYAADPLELRELLGAHGLADGPLTKRIDGK